MNVIYTVSLKFYNTTCRCIIIYPCAVETMLDVIRRWVPAVYTITPSGIGYNYISVPIIMTSNYRPQ